MTTQIRSDAGKREGVHQGSNPLEGGADHAIVLDPLVGAV
jgi:hypothetical protein